MDGPAGAFLLSTLAGLFLAGATFVFARKTGLQPAQTALVETLKENADALKDQVDLLKSEVIVQRDRRVALEAKVARLEAVVVELVDENSTLRQKAGLGPRRHPLDLER
jgi:cell division protein FtsB